jgi:hypothetical protein
MRLYVSAGLRPQLNCGAVIDTDGMTQDQIKALYGRLSELSDTILSWSGNADKAALQEDILDLTSSLIDAINVPDIALAPRPQPIVPAPQQPMVDNPHKGVIKTLRGNFGTGVHEKMHFQPTTTKVHHGVWGTGSTDQVKAWVRLAVDSIWLGDRYLVASKPGNGPGARNYLVFMDQVVGYLSGSAHPGNNQPSRHIELYVDAKNTTVSAFPSDPSIF